MPKRKRGACAYCGENHKLSVDHVIPRCLFINGLPSDLPKVGACESCNNQTKSINDTYLRDMLIMDMDSAEHPIIKELWGKFVRAVQRKQSHAAEDAMRTIRQINLFTSAGIYAGQAYAFEVQHERTTAIMTMIVRGLYHKYIGGILPDNGTFDVYRIRDISKFAPELNILLQIGARHVRVGDGQVFECIYAHAPDHPGASIWFLCFYGKVYFSVATNITSATDNILKNAS